MDLSRYARRADADNRGMVEMNRENRNGSPERNVATQFSFKELAIALLAIAAFIIGNCGVVRALDVALDAIYR
jgi:hypothetical protein